MKRTGVLVVVIIILLLFPMTYALGQTDILEEHFDLPTALDNWEDLSTTGTQYRVEDGVLKSYGPVYENLGWLKYVGPDGTGINLPDSFEITFKARMEQAGYRGSDEVHVAFPFFNNTYLVLTGWRQNARNDFFLQVWIDGTRVIELTGLGGTLSFDETQWHTVKVVKDGLTVSAYLDDAWIYTETVSQLGHFIGLGGTIALIGADGEFWFDDLVVTVPGPPPAVSGCINEPSFANAEVVLMLQGEKRQVTTADANGCYEFYDIDADQIKHLHIKVYKSLE